MDKGKICAELMFILKQVPYSYNKLIPDEIKNKIENNMSREHYNSFDSSKVFLKQKMDEQTIKILLFLFNKYWVGENDWDTFEKMIEE